ncbi:MAG: hypothetical protein VYB75_03585 [Candidatus Neomarinimicrobiota bacterium]|nr:hypothetical protein [Candidatus Neomarinimicrobiota bacterium]
MKKNKYSKAKLAMFRKNILLKIEEINDNIKGIRSTASNDPSMFSNHVSEDHNEGTEAHEVEKSFLLMSRESDYVTNLQKALHRIDRGTYGICEVYQDDAEKCECPDSPLIPEERLLEVPNATKGVFCKEKKKLNLL